ncbi:hypothetical protein Hamer_G000596 [Homarus americanus]|uniref:Uncharacterized protein n=1 Tax=Homarus americanus TaxID=6706 RepID=A0A8J5NDI5_HOMAM|nr:hypothetical protein Hamer_G000596 [Homarus americanus]
MWKGLKKNCTRTTDTQRKKEETFCDELEDLFDVAHPKAMQLLTIKEDRAFLAAQREKGRRGVMAGVDKKIACSIKRREESKSKQSLQQNQASSALEYDELGSSSETESQSSSSSSTSSLAISPVVSSSNRKRATLKVITPELSSTLDRTGISHRSALRIVSATAASLGHDPMELVLNYETVRTSRATHRSGIANEIKEKFQPRFQKRIDPDLFSSWNRNSTKLRINVAHQVSLDDYLAELAPPVVTTTGFSQRHGSEAEVTVKSTAMTVGETVKDGRGLR